MAESKKTLVIVESPSKAKTISKYLGASYKVMASVGHVRDSPKSKLGVDIENDFEPQYINIRGKGDLIKELKKEAKQAGKVYLATDPDREGEAISWHLSYLLDIDASKACRIEFNEITKDAVKNAIKNPRAIDTSLVDAQQARRVLDRIVGYKISPLLWRKIKPGLSAGRVQSATLKLICDREAQIKAFEPKEYWTIDAKLKQGSIFEAKLVEYKGKKFGIDNKKATDQVLAELKEHPFLVTNVEEKEKLKKPFAPFTTPSLQQDASIKLNFRTTRTMSVAQQLYEGIDVKGYGTVGLVTYIRTDSVRISSEAKAAAKAYITEKYGSEYSSDNFYSNKKKEVQDAHEAIRPSHIELDPESIKASLTPDQYKLYKLIWTRFIASQMSAAKYDAVSADIACGDYGFKAYGSKIIFDGFLKVYTDVSDEEEKKLPQLKKGDEPKLIDIKAEQNFTQPPSRYTEASLIKELEENGIGRPSTYAPIVSTLIARGYVKLEKRSIFATELGEVVNELMEEYFKEVVDAKFTAEMEEKLDDIELAKMAWKKVIADYYGPFADELKFAENKIEHVDLAPKLTGKTCPDCGKPLVIKSSRFGEFIACSGYPDCKYTEKIVKGTGVMCPDCGKEIIERRSKKGKLFFGCSGFPACKRAYWDKPVDKKCPDCGALLVKKTSKDKKYKFACSNPDCKYKE